jgi:hypothetical protein
MPELTVEEIECCLMKTKPWKAAGSDRQVWPYMKESVRRLFQTFLDTGTLPQQWRTATIISLKKPNKDDYTQSKAWRPVSLLSTLGKLLETVVAERASFAVETLRTFAHQPLRRKKTEVCGASTVAPSGTHLHSVAEQEGDKPGQF